MAKRIKAQMIAFSSTASTSVFEEILSLPSSVNEDVETLVTFGQNLKFKEAGDLQMSLKALYYDSRWRIS
ncbi:hypothetical protein Clacol_001136 [Clathrus columnatus]|uniref:Uncharacterized protein n=1 Tax=Clathrus columnatus TaxID=1419009 RepID=A0AAV5A4X1_9AGAM|nr:hypothetical protein Clacol_001136 [Clathrus columnatus]